jgi:hypothetical protein
MRLTLTLILAFLGSAAAAHPGHLAELAGHNHWLAGAAVGIAIALGIRGALKGKKQEEPEEPASAEEEREEVAA